MSRFLTLSISILVVALTRVLPHPVNFTPVIALALFGGAKFRSTKTALLVVCGAMFISDMIIGFHSTMLATYLSLFVLVALGAVSRNAIDEKPLPTLSILSLFSPLVYFAITNFGVWLLQDMYPKTAAGLLLCYEMAIPFLQNSVLSSVFFGALLFGSFVLLESRAAWAREVPRSAHAAA